MEFSPSSITALAELIAPKDDGDSEDDAPSSYYAKLNPGNIGPVTKGKTETDNESEQKSTQVPETLKKSHGDIWDEEDLEQGAEYDDLYDTRTVPNYDLVYKQAVATEDMYLGMGNKTPATSSCEDMVINVQLPATNFKDVHVDLTDKHLSVRSPKYKLGLHLPHPCDSKNGKAQWLSDQEVLKVTVRMKREYDFMNF